MKNFVTKEDLADLRNVLLQEFRKVISVLQEDPPLKQWVKNCKVCEMLGICEYTLQSIRKSGALPFTKLKGQFFYDYEDVRKLVQPLPIKRRKMRPPR